MLKNKNLSTLKSERSMYFPNLNSLMKISLGLILFTLISTVIVYAENKPVTFTDPTVRLEKFK